MNKIVYILFVSIFTLDYLSLEVHILSHYVTWVPEVLSVVVLMMIALKAAAEHSFDITARYVILFIIISIFISIGIIINSVAPGTIVVGLRVYLKYLPFFLLPVVHEFSCADFQKQIKVLLIFSMLQLPLVIYQRLFQFKGISSGDVVSGTLNDSSILSIYLISGIAILLAFYMKNLIKTHLFILILLVLFLPTTLNETKGTLILLPFALLIPALLLPKKNQMLKQMAPFSIFIILVVIFVLIYDVATPGGRMGSSVVDFMSSKDRVEHYLFGGAASKDVGSINSDTLQIRKDDRVGRIDSILLPLRILSDDPYRLFFGLGIGNVSDSFISQFSGEYSRYVELGSVRTVLSQLLWELGVGGVLLVLCFLCIVLIDAYHLRVDDDIYGAFALGWVSVIIMMVVSFPYKNLIVFNVLGYLFFYFSGCLAARRYRLRFQKTLT